MLFLPREYDKNIHRELLKKYEDYSNADHSLATTLAVRNKAGAVYRTSNSHKCVGVNREALQLDAAYILHY